MISKILKIALLAILMFGMNLFAKSMNLERFFEKYSDIDGVTYVAVNAGPSLLSDISITNNFSNQNINNILKGIKKIRILSSKKNKQGKSIDMFSKATSSLSLKKFETFLEVKDNGTKVKILYEPLKGNKQIKNFLMLVKEKNESTIIWIDGIIDFRNLSRLTGMMGSGGFGSFKTATKGKAPIEPR